MIGKWLIWQSISSFWLFNLLVFLFMALSFCSFRIGMLIWLKSKVFNCPHDEDAFAILFSWIDTCPLVITNQSTHTIHRGCYHHVLSFNWYFLFAALDKVLKASKISCYRGYYLRVKENNHIVIATFFFNIGTINIYIFNDVLQMYME